MEEIDEPEYSKLESDNTRIHMNGNYIRQMAFIHSQRFFGLIWQNLKKWATLNHLFHRNYRIVY
jgi:hypothetical protein